MALDIITTHINADFDCLASMVLAKKLYPDAILVFAGAQDRNVRQFLHENPGLVETTRLRTVRKLPIERLIIVDTRQANRMPEFADLFAKGGFAMHIYDHHPPVADDIKAEVEFISEVGATATILVELLQQRGLDLSPIEATIGLLGIYEDTGSLSYKTTTPRDLRAAAYLLEKGGDLASIGAYINRELRTEDVTLLNRLIEGSEQLEIHGIKIVISALALEEYRDEMASLVHKLVEIGNLTVFFALVLMEDRVLMIARSRLNEVNVGDITRMFGGGGHATAASATIRNCTLAEVRNRLITVIGDQVQPLQSASHYMTTHIKTVLADATLEQAAELMDHYSKNVLPVERDDILVGIITRQEVDKALRHGLGHQAVAGYMTTDAFHAEPDTPMAEVLQLMAEQRLVFLPVVAERKVVGIITRSDLLRAFHHEAQARRGIGEGILDLERSTERNVRQLLEERLPPHLKTLLEAAAGIASELHCPVFIVGGLVRDLLLGRENFDIDLVVEGDGIRFAQQLAERLGGRVTTYYKFNTAGIILPDGFKLDVASARLEYYQQPAALPIVEPGSVKQDLARRDFSVNALAIQLNREHYGRLIDYFGGQQDIRTGVIRVLHSLSFIEDPTRAFRAVRFEQRFGFLISKQTLNFIATAIEMNIFSKLSGRRISDEVLLILAEKNPLRAIRRLEELNLLQFIHPKLHVSEELTAIFNELDTVLTWYRRQFPESTFEYNWVHFVALIQELARGDCAVLCRRLEFSLNRIERVMEHYENVKKIVSLTSGNPETYHHLFYVMHSMDIEPILLALAVQRSSDVQKHIIYYLTHLRQVQPQVRGRDLIELGLTPGPLFSTILKRLLRARLSGEVGAKDEEIALVRREFLVQGPSQVTYGI